MQGYSGEIVDDDSVTKQRRDAWRHHTRLINFYEGKYQPITLHKIADIDFSKINTSEFNDVISFTNQAISFLRSNNSRNVNGISSKQLDYNLNAFAILRHNLDILCCYNTRITYESPEKTLVDEKYVHDPYFVVKIKRSNEVRIKYFDINGNVKIFNAKGLDAFHIQQQMDILHGIFFADRASKIHRNIAERKKEKTIKKIGLSYDRR